MKADTILTLAGVGAIAVVGYFAFKSVSTALKDFKLPEFPQIPPFPNIPEAVNNWNLSFVNPASDEARNKVSGAGASTNTRNVNAGSPTQKDITNYTQPSVIGYYTSGQQVLAGTITGAQVGTHKTGVPIYASPKYPSLAVKLQDKQFSWSQVGPRTDTQSSLIFRTTGGLTSSAGLGSFSVGTKPTQVSTKPKATIVNYMRPNLISTKPSIVNYMR